MSIRQMFPGSIVKPGFNPFSTLGYVAPYDLFTWGDNDIAVGRLGLNNAGAAFNKSSPTQVGSATEWKNVETWNASTFAIKNNGTLWAWGYNAQAQLGDSTYITRSSPVQIGALTTWSSAAPGPYCTYAIKTDGTLWCWGDGTDGSLGLGDTNIRRSSPVQIGALTNWLQVTAGPYYGLAVKTDGTLWGWGRNTTGQIGDGTAINRSSPVQVGSLTTWASVSSRQTGTMAITTSGALYSWGQGGYGSLGTNNTSNRSSPVQVGSLTNWSSVSIANHCMAIKTDGTLWAWGNNAQGQLGLGDQVSRSSPVQVGSLQTWRRVSSGIGTGQTHAITTGGALWSWGSNSSANLGHNNTTYLSSPKQVGALTSWAVVSAGEIHTAGLN
jgi:alpha-tubulin suppressor-like RCC1 family protein